MSESCGGDGSRAPPEDVAACGCDGEDGGGAVDGLAESTAGDKVRAPRRYGKRKRKRKQRGTEEEELEAEVEPAHDSEDDCAVYGDADCDEVDDAVGGGDNQDDEVHGGLRIEEPIGSQFVHGSQGQGVGSQAQRSQAQGSQEQGSQGLSGYAAWFECSS